ncbi:MAG: hypothetical protein WAZ19_01175 [Anaerolineae bacterium]
MTKLYTLQMVGIFESEEPIIHTEETIGNVAKIKRMKVFDGGKSVSVPALSGNSFRGQLRDLMADEFIQIVRGQTGPVKMSKDNYGVIFSGGILGENSDMNTKLNRFIDNIPLIRVMGSAFGNVMLPSKLSVSHLIPLTRETRQSLRDRLSIIEATPEGGKVFELQTYLNKTLSNLPEAEDISFEEGPLTRKDDTKNPHLIQNVEINATQEQSPQMIYHVECIASGILLLQRIASKFPLDEHELGCFFSAMAQFAQHPMVGGRGAAGYGRVNFLYKIIITPIRAQQESAQQESAQQESSEGTVTLWLDTKCLANYAGKLQFEDGDKIGNFIKIYHSHVRQHTDDIKVLLAK